MPSVKGSDQYFVRREINGALTTIPAYKEGRDPEWIRATDAALEYYLDTTGESVAAGEAIRVKIRGRTDWEEFKVTGDVEPGTAIDELRDLLLEAVDEAAMTGDGVEIPPPWLTAILEDAGAGAAVFTATSGHVADTARHQLERASDEHLLFYNDLLELCAERP